MHINTLTTEAPKNLLGLFEGVQDLPALAVQLISSGIASSSTSQPTGVYAHFIVKDTFTDVGTAIGASIGGAIALIL